MKILPSIAGLILAGTFTSIAQAAPSKGEVLSLCRAEINSSFEEVTRIRTSRFRDKSTGMYIKLKVTTSDGESHLVNCTHRDGIASLTSASGEMIASKTEVASSDS